ncbi:MAG TPA: glycosyltransferase family 87 protein [Chloroflexota bacterium]|nr:glycosyltransferase family 87 protein [Chloroflexota bacterium]
MGTGLGGVWRLALRLERALDGLVTAGAVLGVLGAGLFTATLLVGRTGLPPSISWLATAGAAALIALALWALAARADSPAGSVPSAWRRTAWPSLFLLPGAGAAAAAYLDDATNHLYVNYHSARESVLVYGLLLYALAQAWFWIARWGHTRHTQRPALFEVAGAAPGPPGRFGSHGALLLVALGLAAYLNASVVLPWIPHQSDLMVNLRGARELLAGAIPYNDDTPVWADRVHLLPVTLLTLFAPLSTLPDATARAVFFLGNQLLWLAALGYLVSRLVPPGDRLRWLGVLLFVSATFWPWQESIRFGQQDGLLVLLFGLSIVAALRGRSVASGLALGAAIVVKPLSIWLPLVYLVHGRLRPLVVAGLLAAGVALASLPVTGIAPWLHFVQVEVPEMLPGTARGTNIPLPSLHARLFVGRERLGDGDPAPRLGAISALNATLNALGLLLIARLALRVARRLAAGDPVPPREWLLDAGLGLTLTLLLAPMAWQHYASWLIIPLLVLALPEVWGPLSPRARLATAALAGLGYLLLSLDDVKLLGLLGPLVTRWPALMSFYALGLTCTLGALLAARLYATKEPPKAEELPVPTPLVRRAA